MVLPTTRLGVFACFTGFALFCAAAAGAQELPEPWGDPLDRPPRVDLSGSIGVGAPTDWSDLVVLGSISPVFGVFEQVLVRDLRVKRETQIGGAVTYWRGRYGFRAAVGLSRSTLLVSGDPVDLTQPTVTTVPELSIDLDTWSYDVNGVIGLVEYSPRSWVWPYVSLGFGGVTYDLAQPVRPPLLTFIDRDRTRPITAEELVLLEQRSREFLLAVDEVSQETVFAVNAALGTDFRLPVGPGGLGVRLELSDHVTQSPVGLRIGELRRNSLLTTDTGVRFKLVHNLRAAAGFVVFIKR
jgi:hypothetical protein